MISRGISGLAAIVVHHTASPRSTTLDDVRRWHVERNGWEAIGYHFFIDASGSVYRCRRIDQVGAHCRDHNTTTIGICVAGDNTNRNERWSATQIEALTKLVRALRMTLGPVNVVRHRDLVATLCPGLDDDEWAPLKAELTFA